MRARRKGIGFWMYFWALIVLLYIPLVVLAFFSLNDSQVLALPWRGFSARWYEAIGDAPALVRSLNTSVLVASVSSLVAVIIGGAIGVAWGRFQFPGRAALLVVAMAPLVIPFLGLGVALLLTFLAVGAKPSTSAVVIAHATVSVPSVVLLVGTRLIGLEASLEEAALDLGATWRRILYRVYIPLMAPSLVAGFFSAFVLSFNEFYLALYLAGPNVTLPVYFFSAFRNPNLLPPTLALNTLVTALILAVVLMISIRQLIRGGHARRSESEA
jgi:spermidine/putrescine transport system permease protein